MKILLDLGPEVLLNIFLFLRPLFEVVNLVTVCQSFYEIIFSKLSTYLWTAEPLLICIEPNERYSRYFETYPYNRVYRKLAFNLLSKCCFEHVEIHCFMDDVGLCIEALNIKSTVSSLRFYLDRNLSGKPPLDVNIDVHRNNSCFPRLQFLSIEPAVDAKTDPVHILSKSGCEQVFSLLGNEIKQLHINRFSVPVEICTIFEKYCPSITELSFVGSGSLEHLYNYKNLHLTKLYIQYPPCILMKPLNFPNLKTFSCQLQHVPIVTSRWMVSCIPENTEDLSLTSPADMVNDIFIAIGKHFNNLYSLNYSLLNFWEIELSSANEGSLSETAMLALQEGCPRLHTLHLPSIQTIGSSVAQLLSKFLYLNMLSFWEHQETLIVELPTILSTCPRLTSVLVKGLGPDEFEVGWMDLRFSSHLLHKMSEWSDLKARLAFINSSFPHISIDTMVVHEFNS